MNTPTTRWEYAAIRTPRNQVLGTHTHTNINRPNTYNPKHAEKVIPPQYTFGYKSEHKWAKEGAPSPVLYQNNDEDRKNRTTREGFKFRKTGFSTGK